MRRLRDDSGSVLMLVMGLVPVLLLMVTVGTDLSVLFTLRRALAAEADAAAVAAAQAADLEALYTGSGMRNLPLDCAQARRIVLHRVGGPRSDSRVGNSRLASMTCNSRRVSVRLRSTIKLPFASHLGIKPTVAVAADAAARAPLR
ncbi:MAG: pilus assembly protein TadG-related protein [Candidatus Nanopelagicales bacterium]